MKKYALLNGSYTDKTLYDLNLVRAEENYVYDQQNKKYLDLRSGLWNVSLGYDVELYDKVLRCFEDVLSRGIPYLDIHSFTHNIYDEVAKKILKIMDEDFERVIFTNSGSENTELSLKIADYLNKKGKKNRILTFKDSYHGTFFGGVSISGIDQKINRSFFPKYGEVTFIDYPKNEEQEKQILDYLENNSEKYDVMFIEPVLASAGIYFASAKFFNQLMDILRQHNVLIVFDEVATGFFKVGLPFFFNLLDDTPDIVCLSKSINNGMLPFGCVCVSQEIDSALQNSSKVKEHFSTQNGNILGMQSANVVLEHFIENGDSLKSNVKEISNIVSGMCNKAKISYRNLGIMTSIRINRGQSIKVLKELERLGILVYLYDNEEEEGISIMPQINIDKTIFNKAMRIIIKKSIMHQ